MPKVTGHEKVGRGYWRELRRFVCNNNAKRMRITRITPAIRHVLLRGGGGGGHANLLLLTGRLFGVHPSAQQLRAVAVQNDPEASYAIMSVEVSPRWPCAAVLLLLVAAVSCSVSIDDADNVLPVDGFGNEEIKESNLSEFAYPPRLRTLSLGTSLKMFS